MTVTEHTLNRATLSRQLLLERSLAGVADALRRIVAVQAQHPASPYLALWSRVDGFDANELDRAFTDAAVVKATMMRITLHAVHHDDHQLFRTAMMSSLRAAGFNDRRFTDTGISVDEADALVPALEEFTTEPRTRVEIEQRLGELLGAPPPAGLWRALRFTAPWRHAPGDHPWAFGDPTRYVAAPAVAPADEIDVDAAVAHLVRRYLTAFGPATVRDMAQFTMLRHPALNAALALLGDEVLSLPGPAGALLDVAGGQLPDDDTPASPRLLGMWDNVLLAYADRTRMIPDGYRPLVIRRNGDVLPTVLVDGRVAGVWRPAEGDDATGIEITAFHPWPSAVWEAVEREAEALHRLVSRRDPSTYSRYTHWWKRLPDDHVRVVASTS